MTNIVNFRTLSEARKESADAAAVLIAVARGLDEIGAIDFKSEEDIQQALSFIALSNLHLRHLVGQIKDDGSRARMLAETSRIDELVEDAGKKLQRFKFPIGAAEMVGTRAHPIFRVSKSAEIEHGGDKILCTVRN